MKRLSLLLVLLATLPLAAMAESSAVNRGGSHVAITTTPLGLHIPTLMNSPLAKINAGDLKAGGGTSINGLAWIINEDWMVGFTNGSANFEYKTTSEVASLDTGSSGLYGRYFLGNSFNLLVAMDKRSIKGSGSFAATDGGVNYTGAMDLDTSATVLTLGIGNQWQTDFGLIIGFDWLAYSTAMGSKSSAVFSGSGTSNGVTVNINSIPGNAKTSMETGAADALDTINTTLNNLPGALILTLGFAF